MMRRARIRKLLAWLVLTVVVLVAGALGFAYAYVTDGSNLAALIRDQAPRFLPGSIVQLGKVQWRPMLGQVTLNQVYLWQDLDGARYPTAQVAWMNVRCDWQALWQGKVVPTEVSIAQPVLRLRHRADGRWNLQGLLADPWPGPPLEHEPVVQIRNGTIELAEEGAEAPLMVLRDVELRMVPSEGGGPIQFDGTARGGPFERVRLEGTYDRHSGRLELTSGDLTRLELSDIFCRCLPVEPRARFAALGLTGGEIDLTLRGLTWAPDQADPVNRLTYSIGVQLRGASLERPEMPFPLTGVSLRGGLGPTGLTIERAEGRNGKTLVTLRGAVGASETMDGPLDLHVEVTDLELDERLQRATPTEFAPLWKEYRPTGWVDLGLRLVRPRAGAPMGFGLTVRCQDVGVVYHLFPYPVSNVQGTLVWQGSRMDLDLRTRVGGSWVTCKGTVDQPGPEAVVKLDFAGAALPMNEELLRALPPQQRAVVAAFRPAGTVRGVIHVARTPPAPPARPNELVNIHAELDLNENCSVRWEGLPYPIQDLTGHLDLRPDRWTFRSMKGRNGAAVIRADGEVVQPVPGVQDVVIDLVADHLPFDQQLREALPPEWQATWATLNPSGFSRVEARITGRTGETPHYHLKVVPEPASTRVKLVLTDVASAPGAAAAAPRVIELPPMEKVAGTFLYDDGAIRLSGVSCEFREAPVTVRQGTLNLDDTGAFRLSITDLLVTKLRLDAELRKIMPPVMAQFAHRLDDGRPFWVRGGLDIGWSGRPGEPARCDWRDVTVVFTGNTIQTTVPIEQLQGQIDNVHGWSDGRTIEVGGAVNLSSVRLGGQQLTDLSSPLSVANGQASLSDIKGSLLGGTVYGSLALSLDTTPHYRADLQLIGADLSRYTMTLPGRQTLKGLVEARLTVEGQGNDLRTCAGEGWARVTNGDLGQLPVALRWIKTASFRPPTRTAFDSAEFHAVLGDGRATFDRITLTGDAFSLDGSGTLELQGSRELDLRLSPSLGRDERRVPLLSEAVREARSRVVDVHITGPSSSPTIRPEPLPGVWSRAGEALKKVGERRETRKQAVAAPRAGDPR